MNIAEVNLIFKLTYPYGIGDEEGLEFVWHFYQSGIHGFVYMVLTRVYVWCSSCRVVVFIPQWTITDSFGF